MMHALKTPAFLRPASRPSSPLPTQNHSSKGDQDMATDPRPSRPLTKLALTHFTRRPSPAPVRSLTPTPLVQDGSYLESLGLKLSEAVSKALIIPTSAFAGPDVLNGKRPIPAERGRAIGELIASELKASQGNIHLQRAIIRLLHKPLTVLNTNLSAQLLPLLSSPAFLNPPAPTVQSPNLNPTQIHALAIAEFAAELLDCLDGLDSSITTDHRGDGLKGFREALVSIIRRVANPLINGIKDELIPLIRGLESVTSASYSTATNKPTGGTRTLGHQHQHPSITSLQALMPIYAKALKRYTSSKAMQSQLATFLISVVWTAVVALSHRPSMPRSRSNSASATSATSQTFKKRLGAITPPTTPPPSRFTMKLPGSRPPSPTYHSIPSTASDARVVYDLLSLLPKPVATNDATRVAQEAVDEAFEALAALNALFGAVDNTVEVREDLDLDLLTEGLPVLIALPVLLRWSGHGEPQVIPAMLGLDEQEYRSGCLSGFGRADECEDMVAQRMADILKNETSEDVKTKMVVKYLEGSVEH